MNPGVGTGQNNRPDADTPRKKQSADPVNAPRGDEVHGQESKTHPAEIARPVADQPEDRREHDLKQRHVIVKQVTILHKAVRPSPNDVEMLRFIGVETVADDVHNPEHDHDCEKTCRGGAFSPARHSEICGTASRERCALHCR